MLELAVLGLLKERPMHGYQLSRELGDSLGGLWRVSYGSLYPTLRRLERDAAIESEAGDVRGGTAQEGLPHHPEGGADLPRAPPGNTAGHADGGRPVPDAPGVLPLPAAGDTDPAAGTTPSGAEGAPLHDRRVGTRPGRGGTDDYGRALIEHNRSVTESDITWLEQLIAAERTKNAPTGGLKRRRAALRGNAGPRREAVVQRETGSASEAVAQGETGSSSEAVAQRKERIS